MTTADTARSVTAAADSLTVTWSGGETTLIDCHVGLPDGSVALVLATHLRLTAALIGEFDADLPVVVRLTRLAPVPVRRRVREHLSLAGWPVRVDVPVVGPVAERSLVAPGTSVWTLTPAEILLEAEGRVTRIDEEDYQRATADPLAQSEGALVADLCGDATALADLAALVAPSRRAGARRLVPVALDAEGVTLRAEYDGHDVDTRLQFRTRATDVESARRELQALRAALGATESSGRGH